MTRFKIYKDHYRFYRNCSCHSIHDIPSYQAKRYHISWHKNDKLHRLNGPAGIYPTGVKDWCKNGHLIKTEYPKNDQT